MAEKLIVEFGRMDAIVRRADPDFGERHEIVYFYSVSFITAHGIEYTHAHTFPDTEEGAAGAERLAARVQAAVDAGGIEALDLMHWNDRVIYGSVAYQENEPFIVEREKADALMESY